MHMALYEMTNEVSDQGRPLSIETLHASAQSCSVAPVMYTLHIYIHANAYTCGSGLIVKSCPSLCEPMDCSLPNSSVCGILQARILV